MLVDFLKKYAFTCPSKKYFNIECMGCGFQRSLIALLEGKLEESLTLYPALIPMLALWLTVILHLIFKFKQGALIIKVLFILCAIIILIHFINKQLNSL
jgi:hypothetical protein